MLKEKGREGKGRESGFGMESPEEKEALTINDLEAFERRLAEDETAARKQSIADNTRRGYDSDWRDFTAWCVLHDAVALPADAVTVKRYFIDRQASLSKATLARRIAAVSRIHKEAGHMSPTTDPAFRLVMSGIRRMKKGEKTGAKKALMTEDLKGSPHQTSKSYAKAMEDISLYQTANRSSPVALVTGSTSGIGAAIARRLSNEGYSVVLHSRHSAQTGQALAAELGNAIYIQADLADDADRIRPVREAVSRWGPPRCPCQQRRNQQRYPHADLMAGLPAVWQELHEINVVARFALWQRQK